MLIRYLLILALVFTIGCSIQSKGGQAHITDKTNTTTYKVDGTIEKVENTVITEVKQPDNPEKAANIGIVRDPSGKYNMNISTGSAYNVAKFNALVGSLSPVMWAGIGLCVLGAAVLAFSKMMLLKSGAILIGLGAAMITMAYLIPAYSFIFLIAIIAAIIYAAYIAHKLYKHRVALSESVTTTQHLKNRYMSLEDREREFRSNEGIVNLVQKHKFTPQLIKEVKEKGI